MRVVALVCILTVFAAPAHIERVVSAEAGQFAGQSTACAISATPLMFGTYNVFDVQALDSSAEIRISCRSARPYQVHLSAGAFGSYYRRQMMSTSTNDELEYQVYLDQAHTAVWGNGSAGTRSYQVQASLYRDLRMYGRLFPLQAVQAGEYADVLQVTIIF